MRPLPVCQLATGGFMHVSRGGTEKLRRDYYPACSLHCSEYLHAASLSTHISRLQPCVAPPIRMIHAMRRCNAPYPCAVLRITQCPCLYGDPRTFKPHRQRGQGPASPGRIFCPTKSDHNKRLQLLSFLTTIHPQHHNNKNNKQTCPLPVSPRG
jgi:hypothetical protein